MIEWDNRKAPSLTEVELRSMVQRQSELPDRVWSLLHQGVKEALDIEKTGFREGREMQNYTVRLGGASLFGADNLHRALSMHKAFTRGMEDDDYNQIIQARGINYITDHQNRWVGLITRNSEIVPVLRGLPLEITKDGHYEPKPIKGIEKRDYDMIWVSGGEKAIRAYLKRVMQDTGRHFQVSHQGDYRIGAQGTDPAQPREGSQVLEFNIWDIERKPQVVHYRIDEEGQLKAEILSRHYHPAEALDHLAAREERTSGILNNVKGYLETYGRNEETLVQAYQYAAEKAGMDRNKDCDVSAVARIWLQNQDQGLSSLAPEDQSQGADLPKNRMVQKQAVGW